MIDHQLELSREPGLDRSGDSLGGFARLGEHKKVVRITDEVEPTRSPVPCQSHPEGCWLRSEKEDPLHRTFDRWLQISVDHHARSQVPTYQFQQSSVRHFPCDSDH